MESKLSAKNIDAAANTLLEKVFGDIESIELPVDVDRILKHCNLSLHQGNFGEDDIKGALDRPNRKIMLSENDTFQEKNFTAAHEIGHFKLHDVPYDIMRSLSHLLDDEHKDSREQEADRFAANLMMPEKRVKEWWKLTGDSSLLAKVFAVPEVAVKYRLKQLNIT